MWQDKIFVDPMKPNKRRDKQWSSLGHSTLIPFDIAANKLTFSPSPSFILQCEKIENLFYFLILMA